MASRISLIVKLGISNSLPNVSTSFGGLFFCCSASDARDDSDVLDGDCRGLSLGDTDTELGADESAVALRCSAMRLGTAVDDIRQKYDHNTASPE